MARRTTNRKQQGTVLKQAWEWADYTEPENVINDNVESAYRINTAACSPGNCRWEAGFFCFYRWKSIWTESEFEINMEIFNFVNQKGTFDIVDESERYDPYFDWNPKITVSN